MSELLPTTSPSGAITIWTGFTLVDNQAKKIVDALTITPMS